MQTWSQVFTRCKQRLTPVTSEESFGQRNAYLEAAFRFVLQRKPNGQTSVKNIFGGVPGICESIVHEVDISGDSAQSRDGDEESLGVIVRGGRHEDLYLFYRSKDATLVLRTLPQEPKSEIVIASLENESLIRHGILDGRGRLEFSELEPCSYLLASFSMTDIGALLKQALELREENELEAALALIEDVLELDPQHSLAWTHRAFVLRAMDRADEAIAAIEKALSIQPELALAWRAKGALLRDAERHQEGLNCYLRSLEIDETDFLCWENKGNALRALRREDEARQAYSKARRVKKIFPPRY